MPDNDSKLVDRILLACFILGICALSFIAGAVALYYKLPGTAWFSHAFLAGEALHENRLEIERDEKEEAAQKTEGVSELTDDRLLTQSKVDWDKNKAFNGYTLISMRSFQAAYLVDMQGHVVYKWNLPYDKKWLLPIHSHAWAHAHIFMERVEAFPNGDLLAQYAGFGDTPYGYGIVKMDKNSKVIWAYKENAHHDLYIDRQNGDIYGLVQELIEDPVKGLERLEYPMYTDYIVKLSPEGKELDRISILEAFRDSPYSHMLDYKSNWDHMHTNSVMKLEPDIAAKFPMFKAGQLLVSMRIMNAIAVIDPVSRKVVWATKGKWKAQHAATFLPNGHIMLFDNRGMSSRKNRASRVYEFDPVTMKMTWSFQGSEDFPFFSVIHGFLQRLPNGNTMVSETMQSRALEVAPDDKVAWSYKLPDFRGGNGLHNGILTARRYTADQLPFLSHNDQ